MDNIFDNRRCSAWSIALLRTASTVAMLVLLSISSLCAQFVNGDFESLRLGCSVPDSSAFQGNPPCATGSWFVSHGTPDIATNIGGNTTRFAYMWTSKGTWATGEGLFIQCPTFRPEYTYTVSLSLYCPVTPPSNFIVALANGLVHRNYANSAIPTPASSSVVQNITGLPTNVWQTITFTFTPSSTFQQLWFYPRNYSGENFTYIYMDNVTISATPTLFNVSYNNFSGTPATTSALNSITAFGTSAATGTQQITYRAGNYVRLRPNFRAQPSGSGFFHAYIQSSVSLDCVDNAIGPIPKLGAEDNNSTSLQPYESQELFETGAQQLRSDNLIANYPNPFTSITTIQYKVVQSGSVTLTVVNIFGEKVAELVNDNNHAIGNYSMEFNASGLPPGMYYLRLTQGTTSTLRKMILSP